MSSSSADLSTPQKILRSTLKSKLAAPSTDPSPPSYAPPPPPPSTEDGNDDGRRRTTAVLAPEDGDVEMEMEMEMEMEERVEDAFVNQCARRNTVSHRGRQARREGVTSDDDEEGGVALKKSKVNNNTKGDKMRSRFIEGSMRDRASVPPPRDIIGSESPEPADGEDDDDDDDDEKRKEEAEKEKKKRGFTFGLGSIFRFNPLSLVDEAKAAYIRQKTLHEARERKKKELAQRKKEAEEIYYRLKARGELRGTFVRHIDELVAEAVVTDDDAGTGAGAGEPVFSDTLTGSARKRKYRELCSVGSEVDIVPPIPKFPVEPEEEGTDDAMDTDVDAPDDRGGSDRRTTTSKSGESEAKPRPAGGMLDLVKEKSRIFANTLSPSSTPTTPTIPANGANGKALSSRRNVRKEERLAKKVSNLEQQLERARRELEEARAVKDLPSIPPPQAPPSALSNLTPQDNGSSDVRAPKEEEREEGDTTMLDEEFSLTPLSPNNMAPPSRPPPPPPPGTGEVYKHRPRRPGSRPRSSSSVSLARRVSSAASASAAAAAAAVTNGVGEKHERKKRKGLMDSPPPPARREGEGEVPPVPRVPEGWREAMVRG